MGLKKPFEVKVNRIKVTNTGAGTLKVYLKDDVTVVGTSVTKVIALGKPLSLTELLSSTYELRFSVDIQFSPIYFTLPGDGVLQITCE